MQLRVEKQNHPLFIFHCSQVRSSAFPTDGLIDIAISGVKTMLLSLNTPEQKSTFVFRHHNKSCFLTWQTANRLRNLLNFGKRPRIII